MDSLPALKQCRSVAGNEVSDFMIHSGGQRAVHFVAVVDSHPGDTIRGVSSSGVDVYVGRRVIVEMHPHEKSTPFIQNRGARSVFSIVQDVLFPMLRVGRIGKVSDIDLAVGNVGGLIHGMPFAGNGPSGPRRAMPQAENERVLGVGPG